MKRIKRWLSLALGMFLGVQTAGITAYARPDWPADTGIMAEAGVVMDLDTGTLIYGQNSRVPYFPASITKLMTALVVLEHSSLEEMVTFSNDAVYNVEAGSGNYFKLDEGDTLSVQDCLYALLLRSSNQAANALAEHVAGSRDAFVELMNQKVAELGCTGSLFKNPSGLNDPEQVVTAYDMALIAKAAFANPVLLEISSARNYTLPPTKNNPEGLTFDLENKILKAEDSGSPYYCEGAVAGKTGYTSLAGNTLVMYAERDGRHLAAVILKGQPDQYYLDAISLLNFGFERFQNLDAVSHETSYTEGSEPIVIGETSYLPKDLLFRGSSMVTLPKEAEYADAEKTLDTNVPEGSPEGAVAVLRYIYNERKVGELYLCKQQEGAGSDTAGTAGVPAGAPSESVLPSESRTESQQGEELHSQAESGAQGEMRTEPESQPETPKEGSSQNGVITAILIGIGAVLILVLAAGAGYWIYEEKQEKKRREERRARRRARILESGVTEEEFEQMLLERKNRGK